MEEYDFTKLSLEQMVALMENKKQLAKVTIDILLPDADSVSAETLILRSFNHGVVIAAEFIKGFIAEHPEYDLSGNSLRNAVSTSILLNKEEEHLK